MNAKQIRSVVARLPVNDLEKSVTFYRQLLGFEETDLWPDTEPTFAILRSGSVELQLSEEAGKSPGKAADREPASLWCDVENVEALHRRVAQTVRVEWGPEVYSYGRREFAVRDPDGHLIVLSESADPATASPNSEDPCL